jgi:hypothetical protein
LYTISPPPCSTTPTEASPIWTPVDTYRFCGIDGSGLMEGRFITSCPAVEKGFRRRAVERFRARDRQPFFGNVTALVVARLAEVNRRRTSRVLTLGQVVGLVRKAVASAEEAGVKHGVAEWYEPAEGKGWNAFYFDEPGRLLAGHDRPGIMSAIAFILYVRVVADGP